MHNHSSWLVGLTLLAQLTTLSVGSQVARAQAQARAEPSSQPPAEVWLTHALNEQRLMITFGRYAGAPANVLLAAGLATLPFAVDAAPSTVLAYVSSSALMLTAAIGVWAQPEPYNARRWYGLGTTLGFTALGAGLVLSCLAEDDACGKRGLGRGMQIGIGAFDAGLFLSTAVTALLMPPPSPTALQLSVQNLSAPERHARVLEFLELRDRQRRIAAYVWAPWGVAIGGVFLANAHDAATTEGQVLMYGAGAALIAFNLVALLYEQLRAGDAAKLRMGESP
jgi:hypothetical protein